MMQILSHEEIKTLVRSTEYPNARTGKYMHVQQFKIEINCP